MKNAVVEGVLFVTLAFKGADHLLDDIFEKQVGDTLVQGIAECKFQIKRQFGTFVCDVCKLPIGDEILKQRGMRNVHRDGVVRV